MYKQKFKLGVIIDQKLEEGGGYQQSLNYAFLANKLKDESYDVKFFSIIKNDIKKLKAYNIDAEYLNISLILKIITFIRINPKFKFIKYLFAPFIEINPLEKIFKRKNIDLVYFLSPSRYVICLGNLNFIYSVWDICHRNHPEFPEVRMYNQFEIREFLYSNILPKATGIIVDSLHSKEKICQVYNLEKEKVLVIPFEPAPTIKNFNKKKDKNYLINLDKNLKFPYIFYPAQFWPHKNHIYILEGINFLNSLYGLRMNIIFTGSDKGNLKYIKKMANNLNIQNQVSFLGFVSNEILLDLYIKSFALVMPSYFGPTNLPPIEAFKLGVPVFYPDLPGMREYVGNAAILIDLNNPKSFADQLFNLYEKKELRKNLINKGNKKYEEIKNLDRTKKLSLLIREYFSKRKCWG